MLFHNWCHFLLRDIITRRCGLWLTWKGSVLHVKLCCDCQIVSKGSPPLKSHRMTFPVIRKDSSSVLDDGKLTEWFSAQRPSASLRHWRMSVQTHNLTTKTNLWWPPNQFEFRNIFINIISILHRVKEKQMESFPFNQALDPSHFIHSQESAKRNTWRFPSLTQIGFWWKSYGY